MNLPTSLSEFVHKPSTLNWVSFHLITWHLILLSVVTFTCIWYIIQYESQSNNDLRRNQPLQASSCFFYLCFYSSKCIMNLTTTIIRTRSTVTQDQSFSRDCLLIDLVFFIWTGLGVYCIFTNDQSTSFVTNELFWISVILVVYDLTVVLFRIMIIVILLLIYRPTNQSINLCLPYVPLPATHDTDIVHVRGLNDSELSAIPFKVYHKGIFNKSTKSNTSTICFDSVETEDKNPSNQSNKTVEPTDQPKCTICLGEYLDGELVRQLQCSHHYHQSCVDQWLNIRGTCCLCIRACSKG